MPVLKKKRNAKPRPSPKLTPEQVKWRDDVFAVYCSLGPKRSVYKLEQELKARHAKLAAHKTTLAALVEPVRLGQARCQVRHQPGAGARAARHARWLAVDEVTTLVRIATPPMTA
jgi:hypothetical protein